ncbi:MAG: radical SAM protein, partial [Treponema sp.]|nr:radical SAM protein [Treponema sp.]
MNTLLLAYDSCRLCPHDCKVNRNKGELGICGESAELRLAFAGLHFGEEPLITGSGGSGTIFVSGCNLGCAFCQNFQISQEKMGSVVSTEDF